LDSKKLEYFRKRLIEEKQEVFETLQRMEDHNGLGASMVEDVGELSAYDNHPADLGTEMFMTEMQGNLQNHEGYRIAEIERALHKVEDGSYGKCELCGAEIPEERLEILPDANICMACADDKLPIEAMNSDRGRPVEEELLTPPFSRTNKDAEDYTGFDGEDSWQEVARFNYNKNDPSFNGGDDFMIFDETPHGLSQSVEDISNEEYLEQLPDGHDAARKLRRGPLK